jgi:hypothetical protein
VHPKSFFWLKIPGFPETHRPEEDDGGDLEELELVQMEPAQGALARKPAAVEPPEAVRALAPAGAEESGPLASRGGWQLAVDPASGSTYYYHAETGDVSWEPPHSTDL